MNNVSFFIGCNDLGAKMITAPSGLSVNAHEIDLIKVNSSDNVLFNIALMFIAYFMDLSLLRIKMLCPGPRDYTFPSIFQMTLLHNCTEFNFTFISLLQLHLSRSLIRGIFVPPLPSFFLSTADVALSSTRRQTSGLWQSFVIIFSAIIRVVERSSGRLEWNVIK